MEGLTLGKLIAVVVELGPFGLVLVLWWHNITKFNQVLLDIQKRHEEYRETINEILNRYREDMLEQRKMYEANVDLVKKVYAVANDYSQIASLNTQAMTKMVERIEHNWFCPQVKKAAVGKVGE